MQDDSRLAGQEAYLLGVTLIHQPWKPTDPKNDHDHCEFCWAKFAAYDGCLHAGYATEDYYRWVCETCFRDFKDRFQWRVK
jgi:hypothetical protein